MCSPPTPTPMPCWGPDRAAQEYSATTARSVFDSLLNPSTHSRDPYLDPLAPPPEPLLLLSRVTDPNDWTPAVLAGIGALLKQYEATDHLAAWATYNILLEKALMTRNAALVRRCLQEHRWHLCMRNPATSLVLGTKDACRDILPLMVADPRFGPSFIQWLVRMAVGEYMGKDAGVVTAILQTPRVDPWIVWQQALDVSANDLVVVPKIWRVGESDLVDAEWAWGRSCAATAEAITVPVLRPSEARAGGARCPKLLIELPEDIQFKLHQLLDAASVGRIRSSCRSLTSFPMTRFGYRQLHFECLLSTTDSGYLFDSSRIRSLLNAALSEHSHPSTMPAADLIGRVLVESARHLTDPDFSLDLLTMLGQQESHSSLVTVYLTWSLHTLLTCSPSAAHINPTTSAFLARLLTHPSLPRSAWSFVIHTYPTAHTILSHATLPLPAIDQDGCTSIPHLLLYLTRTRTLPEPFQSTHPDLAFRAPDAFSFEPMPPSTGTHLVLSLAVLSDNVHTVATMLKSTPADSMNIVLKQLALSLAVGKCSSEVVRSLLTLIRPPAHVVRAVLVGKVSAVEAAGCLAADGRVAVKDRGQRVMLDVLFAYLQDSSEIRSLLAQLGYGSSRQWVRARAMWWWLGMAGKEDSERLEQAKRWVEAFLEEVDEDAKGDGEDEWVGELRERWEEQTGRGSLVGRSVGNEAAEKGHGKKADECAVQ